MKRGYLFYAVIIVISLVMVLSMAQAGTGMNGLNGNSAIAKSSAPGISNQTGNSTGGLTYTPPSLNVSPTNISAGNNWTTMKNALISGLNSKNVPSMAKLPPNFSEKPLKSGSMYLPSYRSAPAPMGVANYGILNKSGTLTPYSYSTRSFDGQLSVNSSSQLYMDGDSFNSFSIQLNSVLNNVTLLDHNGYQFWAQNVVDYSTSTHQLTFIDNIWNFSSPTAVMQGNSILSGNGTVVPGVLYYDVGPTLNISQPFTLNLYLSSSNINGENTVFFNYSISYTNSVGKQATINGSYDRVQFNSQNGSSSNSIPVPEFTVSGSNLSQNGFIPMDSEFIIGGAGGGSNAQFTALNATMGLKYENKNGKYENVRSAFDVGSQTGETSTGINEHFSGATAHLNSGPSYVMPMWNVTGGISGYGILNGTVNPSNAFMMVSQGSTINNESAQSAPLGKNGKFSLHLAPGTYSLELLMSYHKPLFFNGISIARGVRDSKGNINLPYSESMGIYTPLYASNNNQLKNLSVSGKGTEANPYIIAGTSYFSAGGANLPDRLNPVFSQINDYLYPVFYGIFIHNTTAYAIIEDFSGPNNNPAFQINYDTISAENLLTAFGATTANSLQFVFYNSANLIIRNNTVSGWFSALTYTNYDAYNIPPVASLMLWNVSNSLLERNSIRSAGSGALIYNNANLKSDIYVWNNTFSNCNLIPYGALYGGAPIGLIIASSNNTIYNNKFTSIIPVVSVEGKYGNLYSDGKVTYENRFNVTRQASTNSITVMGQKLAGSIIGTNYTGGNYYYNYVGNGSAPYNGTGVGFVFNMQYVFNGSINYAYDFAPLALYSYNVNVKAGGLPPVGSGQVITYFDINNDILPVFSGGTSINLPNGSYFMLGFTLGSPQILFEPSLYVGGLLDTSGSFIVDGPMVNLSIEYKILYNITVSEQGLPNGTMWGFTMPSAGESFLTQSGNVSFYVRPGLYEFIPDDVSGYQASNVPIIQISKPGRNIVLDYVQNAQKSNAASNYSITFSESGLSKGMNWSANLNGALKNSTSSTITFNNLTAGNYSYSISHLTGYAKIGNGSISINNSSVQVNINFKNSSAAPASTPPYLYVAFSIMAGALIGGAFVYIRFRTAK